MNTRSPYMVLVVVTLSMVTSLVWAQGGSDEGIGLFTAVQGAVTVTHPGAAKTLPVNLHDEVLFKDVIHTRTESRTKAFFDDDSILTVGEKSHVEITEHIYDPDRNLRRMVVKLAQGRLRALVAKVFNGPGSAFEIHTPTAVVAARGTYFVVWVEHGVTGIVNIGHSGGVDFTSEGKTVRVNPGEYSVAPAGLPPTQPLVYDAGPGIGGVARAEKIVTLKGAVTGNIAGTVETTTETVGKTLGKVDKVLGQQAGLLASTRNAIEGTVLKDVPRLEIAKDKVRASHIPVLATPAVPVNQTAQATKAIPGSNRPLSSQTTPMIPVTPPAVISGAGGTLLAPPVVPGVTVIGATPTVPPAPPITLTLPVAPSVVISGADDKLTVPVTAVALAPLLGPGPPITPTIPEVPPPATVPVVSPTVVAPAPPVAPLVPVSTPIPTGPVVSPTLTPPVAPVTPVAPVVPPPPTVPVVSPTVVAPVVPMAPLMPVISPIPMGPVVSLPVNPPVTPVAPGAPVVTPIPAGPVIAPPPTILVVAPPVVAPVAPVAPLVSIITPIPMGPVVSPTVVPPVAPVVPVVPVITPIPTPVVSPPLTILVVAPPVVAPVAPVVPVAPVITTIPPVPVTPPAVISGAVGR